MQPTGVDRHRGLTPEKGMLRALRILLAWGLAFSGFALEMASPLVLFPSEPLFVYTEPGESPPLIRAFLAHVPLPVEFQKLSATEGRIQWKANILGLLSEGVWEVFTDKGSCAFLVVNPLFSIVEVFAQTETVVQIATSTGETYSGLAQPSEPLIFVVPLGCGGGEAWVDLPSERSTALRPARIPLFPSRRLCLFLPAFRLEITSKEVLPGTSFAIGLFSSAGLAAIADFLLAPQNLAEVVLPSGWEAERVPESKCCVSYTGFVPWLEVRVPETTMPGVYLLQLTLRSLQNPEFFYRVETEVLVVSNLSPRQVIGHWNVKEDRLDLTQPFAITYERLLWAASLLGQKIPYTEEVMTKEMLQKLAEEWATSPSQ